MIKVKKPHAYEEQKSLLLSEDSPDIAAVAVKVQD